MSNTQYTNDPGASAWPPPQGRYSYQQPYQQQAGSPYHAGYAGPSPYTQPAYQAYQPAAFQQNNEQATICLVLGILSIVFTGPIGLPLGIVGLVFAKKAQQFSAQSSLTTVGRICSIIGIVLSALVLVFLVAYVLFILIMLAAFAAR